MGDYDLFVTCLCISGLLLVWWWLFKETLRTSKKIKECKLLQKECEIYTKHLDELEAYLNSHTLLLKTISHIDGRDVRTYYFEDTTRAVYADFPNAKCIPVLFISAPTVEERRLLMVAFAKNYHMHKNAQKGKTITYMVLKDKNNAADMAVSHGTFSA